MSRVQAENGQRPETQVGRPDRATSGAPRPGRPAAARATRPATVFERDAEQSSIRHAIESTAAGKGRLVVVEGPTGSGRTLLLNLAVRLARAKGFEVVTARGTRADRDFAYGVARQLFEDRVQKASLLERQRLLAGPASEAGPVFGVRNNEALSDGPERHHRAAHGIAWVARNLGAGAPTLIAIDDADLADIESMRAINRVNQRLDESPIMIMISVRPANEQSGPGPADELRAHSSARFVRIGPLSTASITQMVQERFHPTASDEFCQQLAQWCGGSPALVREVLGAIRAAGRSPVDGQPLDLADFVPESVSRSVAQRIQRLSAEGTAFARAIAVLGDGALAAHAAVLSRLEGSRPPVALDALVRARFIRSEGMGLYFVTPIEGAAILANSPPGDRSKAHLQAARLLRGQGADDDDIAGQLLRANGIGDRWAVAVLERAATGALARGEPELAVRYLERAVAEPPPADRRGPIMAMLGQAEVVAGLSTAAERFEAAAGLLDDPAERAAVYDDLGRRLLINGNATDAAVAFAQGLDEVTDATSEVALRLLAGLIRTVHVDPSLRPRWKDRMMVPPTPQGIDSHQAIPAGRALLAVVYLDRIYGGAPPAVVRHLLLRLVETVEAEGDPQREAATLCDVGLAMILCGETAPAEHALTLALDSARSPGLRLSIAIRLAKVRFLQGRLLDAEADATAAVSEAAAVTASLGATASAAAAAGLLALIHIEQGRLAAAALALDGADGVVGDSVGVWEIASGWLQLSRGQPQAAYQHFLRASTSSHPAAVLAWQPGAALAAHRLGRPAEAMDLATENLRRAQRGAIPGALVEAKRVLGIVTGGTEGRALLRDALNTVTTMRADLEEAKALTELGAALIESGDRPAGVELLRDGMARATACGADGLVEEARRRLRTVSRDTASPTGGTSLTLRERRIAKLAAAGRTNLEIAGELDMSTKAVEWHLRNCYGKLGITTRSELEGVLGTDDDADSGDVDRRFRPDRAPLA
jgi:DNA-binding CsgD family transcriptional regulator